MQFLNHYSALLLWLLLLAGGISIVARRGRKGYQWAILGGVLGAAAAIWFAIKPVPTSMAAAERQPWLLEMQSPFCLACLAQKSEVDKIEKEFRGRLVVRRVDIQSEEGGRLAAQHNLNRTPSFIFFGPDGEEQWRSIGKLDATRLRSSMESSSH